jgi:hypothetical protein
LFLALEEWVTKAVAPPPSRVPTLASGTAIKVEMARLPRVQGFAHPPGANRVGSPVDWADPPEGGPQQFYETFVSAVDKDGNEVAGIRLPSIAVPLGTHTGWNVYRAQPSELADRDGSFIAFAGTRAERDTVDDPRPSLQERYGNHAAYVEKVRKAAAALVADRLLLPLDAEALVRAAGKIEPF